MIRKLLFLLLIATAAVQAQNPPPTEGGAGTPAADKAREVGRAIEEKAREVGGAIGDKTKEIAGTVRDKAAEMAESEQGRKASERILEWIHQAERLYLPWINWVLVAVGIALFVSHAGQLILGKLWGLVTGRGVSFAEVINDFLVAAFAGLALPAVLLIPVGHGAFISKPLAVLTSAAVGILLGMFLYTHGVRQEMRALKPKQDD